MKFIEKCIVKQNKKIVENIYMMELESSNIVTKSKPGQFIQIKVNAQNDPLLRRPISINEIKEDNRIVIYYKVVGKGTDILSKIREEDTISLVGPLGNGFDTNINNLNVAVIGGGIGIAPLYELTKDISKNNTVEAFLGFYNYTYLTDKFNKYSKEVYVSTVTGAEGYKGLVTDLFEKRLNKQKFDLIFACGPKTMLKKISDIAKKSNIKCQVSLEERMACGFGACLGCSIEMTDGSIKKVCTDGPVFWSDEVKFDE
ncbi:dihydroorotate dehydrogenase electron transfer subunit [Caldisalinibacter kiritimatiensis]|uniref:Dihydroorotate dehydrogenase B (NAD(+)), electron transfer subunit n=1 Tax=Caldisalinibacter kiritimatiensis TaxID=1304284 RepID=R1CRJ8_9FIRM|nr:dihydroorotate dehydrogenase electron transfer subunit [Caldisalinibacter kiritimatiensis]EOD01301.1 Dihydroorotate dehydrogenase electron transfer subunit [Caldisalinibacter kiritimatiensis]